ncbi:MAG: AAA family ATPase [Acidimicrobiia bacterium]
MLRTATVLAVAPAAVPFPEAPAGSGEVWKLDAPRQAPSDVGLYAFGRVTDAIDAAIRFQRLRAATVERAGMRIALCLGDLDPTAPQQPVGGAMPQVLELLRQARPGQILATELVTRLDTGPYRSTGAGRGERPDGAPLPTTPDAVLIDWAPTPTVQGCAVALPPGLPDDRRLPFVARPASGVLAEAWAAAAADGPRIVVITGEAGAGKTRVVADLARRAHEGGAVVLWGGCSEASDLPFDPMVRALGWLFEQLDGPARRVLAGERGRDLSVLLPRLFPAATPTPVGDAATDRYWMFDAVAAVLRRIADECPLLLVLDDIHWARPSTAMLAAHLAQASLGRTCVVLAGRNTPLDISESAAALLSELRRRETVRWITLGGLERTELHTVLERLAGRRLDAPLTELADELLAATDGNPLLVGERWHDLVERGVIVFDAGRWERRGDARSVTAPLALRELVQRRAKSLGADAERLLTMAATAGSPFDPRVVALAAGMDLRRALACLDAAAAAGLLGDDAGGQLRFRHDLLAQALHEARSPTARQADHQALAEALVQLAPQRLHLIAHHYSAAVPMVDEREPARWAGEAAARSLADNAYDDAATTLLEALAVVQEPQLRTGLLVALSEVMVLGGDIDGALRAAGEATALARESGDTERLVAAAGVLFELTWRSDGPVADRLSLVDAALPFATGADRARLLTTRSIALSFSGEDEAAVRVGDEAVALARLSAGPSLLTRVIHGALFAGWLDPENAPARMALAHEAVELARRAADPEALLRNLMKLAFGDCLLGRGSELRAVVSEMEVLAERIRQPMLLAATAAHRSLCALAEGQLDRAAAAVDAFEDWGRHLSAPPPGLGLLSFGVLREQGRLEELRPVMEVVARLEAAVSWRPGLAALYAEVGMLEAARRLLDELLAQGRVPVEHDHLRPVTLSYLADACVATAHPGAAAVAAELAPLAGHGIWTPGIAAYGSADRYLGRLLAVTGSLGTAKRHLEAAVRFDAAAGWPTWEAHSRLALGEFLLQHGRHHERDRAGAELDAAAALAERHGLVAVRSRCLSAREGERRPVDRAVALSQREIQVLRLVAAGCTNREIGERLHTSRHTVANQIHSILVKTGCANRSEAIAWALQHRALTPD